MPRIRIPVRVGAKKEPARTVSFEQVGTGPSQTRPGEREPVREPVFRSSREGECVDPSPADPWPDESQQEQGSTHPADEQPNAASCEQAQDWQDRALRMQAEMDTFRRRQRRIAQDQIRTDQEQLLSEMLSVVDNLDRTLSAAQNAPQPLDASLRQGVTLTRNQLLHLLGKYDVQRIHAYGKSFDPHWHQAVAVVPAGEMGVKSGTVIQVTQPGYRRGERLFRPASVVVAQ